MKYRILIAFNAILHNAKSLGNLSLWPNLGAIVGSYTRSVYPCGVFLKLSRKISKHFRLSVLDNNLSFRANR